jgi:hypothetical protein
LTVCGAYYLGFFQSENFITNHEVAGTSYLLN